MNYLAHAIFADIESSPDSDAVNSSADFLFGAILADAYRRQPEVITGLPLDMQNGIRAHKDLDDFDNLPTLTEGRNQVHNIVGSLANPVFDICCDHIIAKNWDRFFQEPLDGFVEEINGIIRPRISLLPTEKQQRAKDMLEEQWLLHYQTEDDLAAALRRFARRPKQNRGDRIIKNIDTIIGMIPMIEPVVLASIPLIRGHCATYIRDELGYEPGMRLTWKPYRDLTVEGQRDIDQG